MRGDDQQTGYMFSYLSPEERVTEDHPLRAVRRLTDAALEELSPRFTKMYSDLAGRRSHPSSCCGRCCCSCSIAYAASGC